MTKEVCIREFGYILQPDNTQNLNLDCCSVSEESWLFLENYAYSNKKEDRFIGTASYNGNKALQVKNFVGVISTPDGTHIEILPKISESNQEKEKSRKLLFKLLSAVPELPFIETTDANLTLFDKPLIEPLIAIFLKKLANVLRQGIRKDYQRVEAEERFLKGQLQMALQIRQPIGRQHFFQIAYDVFSENRAENRLIHAALLKVAKWSKDENNQKLARELRFAFNEIPVSINYKADFSYWKNSRDMVNYQPILPWVKLILNQQSPYSLKDQHAGISFLFPMEKLFEKYVAKILTKQLAPKGLHVKTQLASQYLASDPNAFRLKPDLAVFKKGKDTPIAILDTKWKLIDKNTNYENGTNDPKSGISQADMYQMFAYGHKYLDGYGKLVLIYPKWEKFDDKLKIFNLGKKLTLDVISFDMDREEVDKTIFDELSESDLNNLEKAIN